MSIFKIFSFFFAGPVFETEEVGHKEFTQRVFALRDGVLREADDYIPGTYFVAANCLMAALDAFAAENLSFFALSYDRFSFVDWLSFLFVKHPTRLYRWQGGKVDEIYEDEITDLFIFADSATSAKKLALNAGWTVNLVMVKQNPFTNTRNINKNGAA